MSVFGGAGRASEPARALPYPVASELWVCLTVADRASGSHLEQNLFCPRDTYMGPLCSAIILVFLFLILVKGGLPGAGGEQLRRY